MDKRVVVVAIIVICILSIFIIEFFNNKNKLSQNSINSIEETEELFDEETGLYYIRNNETGEIIQASTNKEDLQFFKENLDYNPDPLTPRSTNLEDFVEVTETNVD